MVSNIFLFSHLTYMRYSISQISVLNLTLWTHFLNVTESLELCWADCIGLGPSLPASQHLSIEDRTAEHLSHLCHLYFMGHFVFKVKSISGKHFIYLFIFLVESILWVECFFPDEKSKKCFGAFLWVSHWGEIQCLEKRSISSF